MNSYSDQPSFDERKLHRKDRERIAKRREIIAAARNVFSRRGYESATLDEIAIQAEFAKGTIYNYFESKESLFAEIIDGMVADIAEMACVVADTGDSAEERFHEFAVTCIDYYKANDDVMRLMISEMGRIQTKERMTNIMSRLHEVATVLARCLDEGARRRAIELPDTLDLSFAFVGMIHNRMVRRMVQNGGLDKIDSRIEAKALTHLFFHGAAPVSI